MKKLLLILCLVTSCISYAQSSLPPCNGNFKGPCFGTFVFPEGGKNAGDKYVGEIKDFKWNGQGTFTWLNGDKYEGQFMDGKRNGQGTFAFADGRKYVGQFKDDIRNGFGAFYNPNGSINQQGLWSNDKFIQAQTPPAVTPPVVPAPINNEIKLDFEAAKFTCADLGFKRGTDAFGNCVLKLSK